MADALSREDSAKNAKLLEQLADKTVNENQKRIIEVHFALLCATSIEDFTPAPVPRSSLPNHMNVEDLEIIRGRRREHLQVDPEQARASLAFTDWRLAVTKTECANFARLKTLLWARDLLRGTGDPDFAELANRLDRCLHDDWRLGSVPVFETATEREAFAKKKTCDLRVMPMAWRVL